MAKTGNDSMMHTILTLGGNADCGVPYRMPAFWGAASHILRLDTALPLAPQSIHWMLIGGLGSEYYCKGTIVGDQETAMAAASAFVGGTLATMLTVGR